MGAIKRIKIVLGGALVLTLALTALGAHAMRSPQADLDNALSKVLREHGFREGENPSPPMCGLVALGRISQHHYIAEPLSDKEFNAIMDAFKHTDPDRWEIHLDPFSDEARIKYGYIKATYDDHTETYILIQKNWTPYTSESSEDSVSWIEVEKHYTCGRTCSHFTPPFWERVKTDFAQQFKYIF